MLSIAILLAVLTASSSGCGGKPAEISCPCALPDTDTVPQYFIDKFDEFKLIDNRTQKPITPGGQLSFYGNCRLKMDCSKIKPGYAQGVAMFTDAVVFLDSLPIWCNPETKKLSTTAAKINDLIARYPHYSVEDFDHVTNIGCVFSK
ncbi:unnamed protein product [Caenorhabditis bovis]|uniref:DUF19 domain-containing protein n=1 Tax=Caenorhabditis bovis TaxID=2654633 RepID=A0A8S1F426_9PELO|nr:unnamed protein product [Caenorhabditis bovis]